MLQVQTQTGSPASSRSPGDGQAPSLPTGARDAEEGRPGCDSTAPLSQSTHVPLGGLSTPETRRSPSLFLRPQGGVAGSHGRVLLFPKYVCCVNTIVKYKPSVGDGGVGAGAGRGGAPGAAPAVSVGEERPCIPSGCQAVQTTLSSTLTWPGPLRERVRGGGGGQGVGLNLSLSPAPTPRWTQKNNPASTALSSDP